MKNYTDVEFKKKLEILSKELTYGIERPLEKKAFILGGQPGAGKSGITVLLEKENKNMIVICGDDFRKEHPHYRELQKMYGKESVEYTKEFAGKMTEALISKLSDEGYSLIIEGTLRTVETPLKTQNELANKGYRVELDVMQVKGELSYLGTINRYEEMLKKGLQARATLKKDHQIVVDKIANNLSEIYQKNLFSNIRLFTREGECVYSMEKTPRLDPGKIIENELKRSLTSNEKNIL